MFSFEQLVAAEKIDGSMLRGGHEPGAGIFRDARFGPLIERRNEGLLREVLGDADVAHHAGETGDQLRLLDPPDCVDRAVCVGSRHGYRLTHLPSPPQAALDRGRLRLVGLVAQLFAWPSDLADLDFALPAWNMRLVQIHEPAWSISSISAFDGASKIAKPPTTSLASVNGPSITVTLPSESLHASAHAEVGCKPIRLDHDATCLGRLLHELVHGIQERLWRGSSHLLPLT